MITTEDLSRGEFQWKMGRWSLRAHRIERELTSHENALR